MKWKVTAYTLTVREKPSVNSNPVLWLEMGDVFESEERSEDGYWIKHPLGWVSHRYLLPAVDLIPGYPLWYQIAYGELGIEEFKGEADNPRIVKYLHSTNLIHTAPNQADNDETPWCAAFVCWCLEQAGRESTDSAWARSYLYYGKRIEEPRSGCIVVLTRGVNSGHVGFFERKDGSKIYILGGNQSDQVNISAYPESRLLGYRIPA